MQRSVEEEAVFGRLKDNWGFRRLLICGMEKEKVEWDLFVVYSAQLNKVGTDDGINEGNRR